MCAQHPALLTTDPCMCTKTWHQSSSLETAQLWWVSSTVVMSQGKPTGHMVQWQLSHSKCGEDGRDCGWRAPSILQWPSNVLLWGMSEQHQVPGCAHHRRLLLGHQQCITGQESSAAPLLPLSQRPNPHHALLLPRHDESILTGYISAWRGGSAMSRQKSLKCNSKNSREDRRFPGHLQHTPVPQSTSHYRWCHTPLASPVQPPYTHTHTHTYLGPHVHIAHTIGTSYFMQVTKVHLHYVCFQFQQFLHYANIVCSIFIFYTSVLYFILPYFLRLICQ